MMLRPCMALNVAGAERVWVENCHASRMSCECFYSRGPCREGLQPDPKHYTKELTFLRCTVTDVAGNAFNNNDCSDNTNILYCRVNGASNFWEGPNRFVRCIGNHVRNCHHYGTFGNTSHRFEHFNHLGTDTRAPFSAATCAASSYIARPMKRLSGTTSSSTSARERRYSSDTIRDAGSLPSMSR